MNTKQYEGIQDTADVAARITCDGGFCAAQHVDRVALAEAGAEAPAVDPSPVERALQLLPKILRWIGAVVLLASAVTFTVQAWITGDSMYRYYSFLGFTGVLAAAGLFCGLKLSETKGARLFLGVAAAFLPAHCAQLGALVYSVAVGGAPRVPQYLVFHAPSTAALVLALAIAGVVLVPLVFAAFSVLARSEAFLLTAVYLPVNMLLLAPFREPDHAAVVAALMAMIIGAAELLSFSKNTMLRNWEGAFCRMMIIVPLPLLLGRTLLFYGSSAIFLSMIYATVGLTLFFVVPRFVKSPEFASASQLVAVPILCYAWGLFADGAFYSDPLSLSRGLMRDLSVPIYFLPMSAIIFGLSFGALGSGVRYRRVAALMAVGTMILQLIGVGGILSTLPLIIVSLITVVYAFTLEEKGLFYAGAFGMTIGLLYHVRYAVTFLNVSPWLSLAVLGTAVVLCASYIEANRGRMVQHVLAFRARLSGWE